jgi:hypothetical protein
MADKALCVGINTYADAPLAGCVNDVLDVAKHLVEKCKFATKDIRLLVDKRATTSEIIHRLDWLVKDAKAGDRLLFHYSGHGTQVADRNGDEIDKKDEVIVPVDFDWTARRMITDDHFHNIFRRIPTGVHFVWISDCCHSGTMTRSFFEPGGRKAKRSVKGKRTTQVLRNRFLDPPADHLWRLEVAKELPLSRIGSRAVGDRTDAMRAAAGQTDELNCAFISGCKDTQTSADATFKGRPNGALTYYLLRALEKYPTAGMESILTATQKALKTAGFDQTPQGSGRLLSESFLGM